MAVEGLIRQEIQKGFDIKTGKEAQDIATIADAVEDAIVGDNTEIPADFVSEMEDISASLKVHFFKGDNMVLNAEQVSEVKGEVTLWNKIVTELDLWEDYEFWPRVTEQSFKNIITFMETSRDTKDALTTVLNSPGYKGENIVIGMWKPWSGMPRKGIINGSAWLAVEDIGIGWVPAKVISTNNSNDQLIITASAPNDLSEIDNVNT